MVAPKSIISNLDAASVLEKLFRLCGPLHIKDVQNILKYTTFTKTKSIYKFRHIIYSFNMFENDGNKKCLLFVVQVRG